MYNREINSGNDEGLDMHKKMFMNNINCKIYTYHLNI